MAFIFRNEWLNNIMDITRKHIIISIGGWLLFVAIICGIYFLISNQISNNTLINKYPIIKNLPYNNFLYEIGYRLDSSDKSGKSIELTITAINAMERRQALKEIKALGYNPINYKIEFLDFESEIK